MTCGIYWIKNQTNGKIYVGQANNIEARLKKHKWLLSRNQHFNLHLQRAFNTGDKFVFETILTCDKHDLVFYEIWHIACYNTQNRDKGYNISAGGKSSMLGRKHSEESKRKIAKAHSGEKHHMYGKHHSE